MNKAEDPLGAAFVTVTRAEAALRDTVRVDLGRTYGPLWMSRVPEEMRRTWQQRQQAEESRGMSRGPEPIQYADIADVIAIIGRDWDVYKPRFGERKAALSALDEFRSLRNAVMHNGLQLTTHECKRAQELAQNVLEMCRTEVKTSTGPAPSSGTSPGDQQCLTAGQRTLYRAITRALAGMSGLLTGERNAIIGYLRHNLAHCSVETLAAVGAKFAALPSTAAILDAFYRDLPPARPTPPDPGTRKPSDWLKWVDIQFMPYRRWLIRTGQEDEEVAQMGLVYEDWLAKAYPEMLTDLGDNLVVTSYKTVQQQLRQGSRVLWLIVDNLSGLWRWEFQSTLEQAGLQVQNARRMLSMLPSSTAVSRRAMLAGRLPQQAVEYPDDESACRQLWRDLGVPSVAFCTSFGQVEEAIPGPTPLIIFVDNSIDRLAHMPDGAGFDRDELMTLALSTLAVKASGALRRLRQAGPAKLIVSTDHGSTRPGPASQVIGVPRPAMPDSDPERHYRYVPVREVSGLNTADWHILEHSACQLPYTAAVARGQRYIDLRPRAFVHGGLSPEETAVNLIVADIGERESLQLVLSQATPPLRRGRPSRLAIRIRNLFDMPIENLVLSLPEYEITFPPLDVPAPRSEAETDERCITLDAGLEVQTGLAYITYAGRYRIAGQPAVLSDRLRIEIQEIYRPAMDNFGDMFNG